jgi:hypothetical protein
MNVHKNARLTPRGRLLLIERITQQGWRVPQAAQAAGLSTSRAYHWLARYRGAGAAALADRSSAPQRCRNRTSAERVVEIERLRRQRLSGPAIARQYLGGRDLLLPRTDEFALECCAFVEFALEFSDGPSQIGDRVVRHYAHLYTPSGRGLRAARPFDHDPPLAERGRSSTPRSGSLLRYSARCSTRHSLCAARLSVSCGALTAA